MKLTKETLDQIKIGNVVKFIYPNSKTTTGVVYEIPANGCWGILCNRTDKSYFGIGIFDGTIEFEVLEEHEPVDLFGVRYDFVCNHQ